MQILNSFSKLSEPLQDKYENCFFIIAVIVILIICLLIIHLILPIIITINILIIIHIVESTRIETFSPRIMYFSNIF